ncbi:hypothetical protein IJH66_01930 [Candidatus Saccharibacteria bacterium]|nr:hypothetical protein [Candidatus Saccharibacteria bacterium]
MQKKGTKKGFTLIELSFAILFISVLLITLTLIASEIIAIYRKGYAIKTVNSVGRDLMDDFSASVAESPPASLTGLCEGKNFNPTELEKCKNDSNGSGQKFIFQQFYTDKIDIKATSGTDRVPYGGVFCTGKYSYIWRTGFVMNPDYYTVDSDFKGLSIKYISPSNSSGDSKNNFRLLKVEDTSRLVCSSILELSTEAGRSKYDLRTIFNENDGFEIDISSKTLASDPNEFLATSDNPIAVFSLNIAPPAQVSISKKMLYSASFILATVSGGVNIMTQSNYCTADYSDIVEASYCAINKFNFSMQANGG